MGGLRELAASFVVPGPAGVAVRTRLKQLTPADEKVLALVGAHLGSLASRDLKMRCGQGLEHSAQTWAARKRALTAVSSSRWAGSLTKATHDQWALARPGQLAHIQSLAVDPAYTSKWGAQHWQKPLTSTNRKTTRDDAAAVAIGRRAQGHPIRRRTAPPPHDRSDRAGHRTVQADRRVPGGEGPRPPVPEPRTRCVPPDRGANAGNQNAQHRSERSAEHESWQQDSLPLSL
ncbi:hypothetical protein ACIRP7_01140 [Streptomyces sp. NPDC102270]|uniref:hypothetical protein n=1 Tax=Streptomyces sp. NPDC102270 TaxID=3366150 RepID=UPI0037FF11BC